jgi:hypothetical protein
MKRFLDRASMTVSSAPGTGAYPLGAAVAGSQTFAAAGIANGDTTSAYVVDGANWQYGEATYSSTGPTLTFGTIYGSSNAGAAINASAGAIVTACLLAEDLTTTAPTLQIFTSGSGTYTTPAGVKWIRVSMVAGGGGGGGGGTGSPGTGTNGGNTTFGSSLLVANGGVGGPNSTAGGALGAGVTGIGPGAVGVALGGGSTPGASSGACGFGSGAAGAASPFGGAGGGAPNGPGAAASRNTGSGGGGGGTASGTGQVGDGGGAGEYVEAIIASPAASYSYAVAAGGSAGAAGTNGYAGGPGGSGLIIVEEHYSY